MAHVQKSCLLVAALAGTVGLFGIFTSNSSLWQPAIVACAVSAAVGVAAVSTLAGYQFTVWIIAAVVAALTYPEAFLGVGPVDLGPLHVPEIDFRNPWLVLIVVQLVMFGMGTKMSLSDFTGVLKMPYPVLIGVSLQFLIMPVTGYALAKSFGFPDEIAAGVVLIGSCSSGLASNVMCYLAGANLALSITLTAVATLLAPLATPFWMDRLAGKLVEVEPLVMMIRILKIVIVPIGAAMLHGYLKHTPADRKGRIVGSGLLLAICFLVVGIVANASTALGSISPPMLEGLMIVGGAILFALGFHWIASRFGWVEQKVHLLSMIGIVYFTTVTTAAGRDNLLAVGIALCFAAILHNLVGYTLGYGMSRLFRLDKQSALTVAFEVGMQNGGMASALAGLMGKLGTVGLAAAVFSPWMNVSGSVLANLIKRFGSKAAVEHDSGLQTTAAVEGEHVAGT